ncbi:MAG: thiamine-phosphate kinase [Actinobacteria bacterium]|nr:thiamine-phosphate kinase [Actinomycetota bacterium]
MREIELLAAIRAVFDSHPTKPSLVIDNGDDGAVFTAENKKVIVAADVAVENIHFARGMSTSFDIGRKITAANLADICAMGGWPEYLLVTAVIPDSWLADTVELAQGISHEAALVGAAIIGGDISRGSELSISITAIGLTEKAIRRDGARPGDAVVISHVPGWSAAGLELLKAKSARNDVPALRAIAQHRAPTINYEKYRSAFPHLTSAIDTSDGLVSDAAHLAEASKVKINLFAEKLRDVELETLGNSMEWILGGGEDHALLGTTAAANNLNGFIVVGEVLEGVPHNVMLNGKTLDPKGYQHQWR